MSLEFQFVVFYACVFICISVGDVPANQDAACTLSRGLVLVRYTHVALCASTPDRGCVTTQRRLPPGLTLSMPALKGPGLCPAPRPPRTLCYDAHRMHKGVQDTHARSQEWISGYRLCGKHGDSVATCDRLFCGTATPRHLTTSHAGSVQLHVPTRLVSLGFHIFAE